jgi:hypothetical protein
MILNQKSVVEAKNFPSHGVSGFPEFEGYIGKER